ncbi:hypothetical protein HPK19_25290 (plasmid) [Arthrobacter citreus]|nr:hypothetical protein HPK19_25290 [Arthrobacter citreus]
MTSIYSDFDVIGSELEYLEGKKQGFFSFKKKVKLYKEYPFKFEIPSKDYLRAKVFCSDVEELAEYKFSMEDFITILYEDFMRNIRKNNGDLLKMYKLISSRDKRLQLLSGGKQKHLKDEFVVEVSCIIQREDALKFEVLLMEIEEVYNVYYSVEDVLEILVSDFIYELSIGNLKSIMAKIVKYWNTPIES